MSNQPDRKRQHLEGNDDAGSKKKSVGVELEASEVLQQDENYRSKLRNAWCNAGDYSDDKVILGSHPFRHGECKKFVENEVFLEQLVEKLEGFEFHEKASDLFQFRQSDDLKSYVDPHVFKLIEYLTDKMLPWLKEITGLPLNSNIDLFLSDYRKDDFLLCHDDELDSRRIAFILYLSKDWKFDFGGNLDLFSATDHIHPHVVEKSLTPEFNKFVFFEVGATSFHQVSEVTQEGVIRLALSGWFYGDPVSRPKIEFPKDEGYLLHDTVTSMKGAMQSYCSEGYLNEETQQDINEQLSEESQVLIPGFFYETVYKSICSDIVEQDVSHSVFRPVGPPNISSFQDACKGPPPQKSNPIEIPSTHNLERLQQLFHCKEFFEFMEKITELPFTTSTTLKATSSLRKYSKGSYSLLRSGGAKQTGEPRENSTTDEKSNEDTDEETDPNLVDIMYFLASKWDETWGGSTIYCAEDGEQLITIPPEGNCLAVVVRNHSVNSYVNYINSNCKDEIYFVYTMTCALDGNL